MGDRADKTEYAAPDIAALGTYRLTEGQRRYLVLKRAADIVLALLLLALLAVPMIAAAAALKLSRPGEPALFRQIRVGKDERLFTLYKFRSMDSGGRVTPFGRFLRVTSLDELPQLFLVLTGDMSLIGPRPLVPQETAIRALRRRLGVYQLRPGLSGLAQISGRDRVRDAEKAAYDREYLEKIGFRMDWRIFWTTIAKVVRRADIEEK